MKRRLVPVLSLLLVSASVGTGCAYFNELYNAKRAFSEARVAEERGDRSTAEQAYGRSLEKAAKSLRRSPEGRWADDALYIIGRAHFATGAYPEARASLQRALAISGDSDMRAGARGYLGAVELRLGNPAAALDHLDAALAADGADTELRAFASLWRARVHFLLGDTEKGWSDLEAAARSERRTRIEALMEQATRAVETEDLERARSAFGSLAAETESRRWSDSLRRLAVRGRAAWGAGPSELLLEPFEEAPWPAGARDSLLLFRAGLAAEAGDTAAALAAADRVARASFTGTGEVARVLMAGWLLGSVEDMGELAEVRALLLPALANDRARALVHSLKMLDVLLERATQSGQPLALFAAGELARDRLGAPALARRLFVTYAELAGGASYGGKALLAAENLGPTQAEAAILGRLREGMADNFYLIAQREPVGEVEYRAVEQRLERVLQSLVAAAEQEAERRDAMVVQTISELDSLKALAARDSLLSACRPVLDSLGVEQGLVRDSALAACTRRDAARFDSLARGLIQIQRDTADTLRADTLPPDTMRAVLAAPPHHPVWALLRPVR